MSATYILLIRSEHLAAQHLLISGESRHDFLHHAVTTVGGDIKDEYAVLGKYDLALITEFPDEEACLAAGLVMNAHGFYTETLRAYTRTELDRALSKVAEFVAPPPDEEQGNP